MLKQENNDKKKKIKATTQQTLHQRCQLIINSVQQIDLEHEIYSKSSIQKCFIHEWLNDELGVGGGGGTIGFRLFLFF